MIKIYLDENLSPYVAQALNMLNKGYFMNVEVESTTTTYGKGEKDEVIIPSIGKKGAILITRDINILRTQLQFDLCKQYNLGAFFIKMPKGSQKHWDLVKLLISNWEEILKVSKKANKPFAYYITPKGVKRL